MKNYFRKKKINYCYGFMHGDFQVICGSMVGKSHWSLASTETLAYVALFDESFNPTRPGGRPSRPAVNFHCLYPKNEKC